MFYRVKGSLPVESNPPSSVRASPNRPVAHHTQRKRSYLCCCNATGTGESLKTGQIFLQQAETVRLISPIAADNGDGIGWKPLSVTDIEGGEDVLVREVGRGTHVGRPIDAVVTES